MCLCSLGIWGGGANYFRSLGTEKNPRFVKGLMMNSVGHNKLYI